MTGRSLSAGRTSAGPRERWIVLLGVVGGLGVGLLSATTSPTTVFALLVAVSVAVIVVRRPEVGALAVICLALVVPRDLLFDRGVPLGGGSLKATDLLIALTLGAWLAHRAIDLGARRLPSRSAIILVLGLVLWGVAAVMTNADRGGTLQLALTDFRPFLSLFLMFPLVAFLSDRGSLRRALEAILLAGAAGGVWISVLYLQGQGSEASFSGGALRVTEVAFVAPLIGAVWALVLLPHCRATIHRFAVGALALVCISALFFTLQRSAWLSLVAAAIIAAVLMTPRRRARLLGSLAVLLACAGFAIVGLNQVSTARVDSPLESGLQRLESVGSYQTDISALHREAETREALKQIGLHPVLGLGLGATLTFFSPLPNPATGRSGVQYTSTYLHNSYTWMAVKTGIPGLLLLVTLIGLTLLRAGRLALRGSSQFVSVGGLGVFASLAALAVVSTAGPHLTNDLGMPYVISMVAGVECLRRLSSDGADDPRPIP